MVCELESRISFDKFPQVDFEIAFQIEKKLACGDVGIGAMANVDDIHLTVLKTMKAYDTLHQVWDPSLTVIEHFCRNL